MGADYCVIPVRPLVSSTGIRPHWCPGSGRFGIWVVYIVIVCLMVQVLSPDRLRSLPHHLSDALSPPDLRFLVGSQRLVHGLPDSDSSEPFDESWPSTEGSGKTPERDERPTASDGGATDKQTVPGSEDSVLAR